MVTIIEQKKSNDGEGFITLAQRQLTKRVEYVTWRSNNDYPDDFYWGHYYDDLASAKKDFNKRG